MKTIWERIKSTLGRQPQTFHQPVSERAHSVSPAGIADFSASADVLGFSFAELFLSEQEQEISTSLISLFPDARNREEIQSIGRCEWSLDSGSESNIGRIQRAPKYLAAGTLRTMPRLPSEIDFIDVSFYRVPGAPSFAFLAFHVGFEESVRMRIEHYVSTTYVAKARKRLRGVSYRNPELDRESDIDKYLHQIESLVQTEILRHITGGYFGSHNTALPVLEIFGLRGFPPQPSNEWLDRTREWRRVLGLDVDFYGYGGEGGIVQPAKFRLGGDNELPWRLALLLDPPLDESWGTSRLARLYKAEFELHDLLILIVVDDLERTQARSLVTFRNKIRSGVRSRLSRLFALIEDTSLLEELSEARDVLRRVRREFGAFQRLRHGFAGLLAATYQREGRMQVGDGTWLQTHVLMHIEALDDGVQMVRDYALDLVNVRNIVAILAITGLTLVATIIGIGLSLHGLLATGSATSTSSATPSSTIQPSASPRPTHPGAKSCYPRCAHARTHP